jgi:hypothetical protein
MNHCKAKLSSVCVLLLFAPPVFADNVINIRVSYKIVLHAGDGARPTRFGGGPVRDQDIDDAIEFANELLASFWRGYRFLRVDPITEVGGGQFLDGPSQFFDTDFFGDGGGAAKDFMESEAKANVAEYAWNHNAINIYITNGISGGICSFYSAWVSDICLRAPVVEEEIAIIGGASANNGRLTLHEMGHFFDLCHTQGCPCGCCDSDATGDCNTVPKTDCIGDTVEDLACWDQDDISANRFAGRAYGQLTPGEQNLVDETFLNVMSYHGSGCGQGVDNFRMTEGQLDRWGGTALQYRGHVTDGDMYLVAWTALSPGTGADSAPFLTVANGVNAANPFGGDILVIKSGWYPETLRIDIPLTLRASRVGAAIIGSSAMAAQEPSRPSPTRIGERLRELPGYANDPSVARLGFPGSSKQQDKMETSTAPSGR